MTITRLIVFLICVTPLSINAQNGHFKEKYYYFQEYPTVFELNWQIKKGKIKSGEFSNGTVTKARLNISQTVADTIKGTLLFQGESQERGLPLNKPITLSFEPTGRLESENFWVLPVKEHRGNGLDYRTYCNVL